MSAFSWLFHVCIARIDFFYFNLWKLKAGQIIGDHFRYIHSSSFLEFRQCARSFLQLFRSCIHIPTHVGTRNSLYQCTVETKREQLAFVHFRSLGSLWFFRLSSAKVPSMANHVEIISGIAPTVHCFLVWNGKKLRPLQAAHPFVPTLHVAAKDGLASFILCIVCVFVDMNRNGSIL